MTAQDAFTGTAMTDGAGTDRADTTCGRPITDAGMENGMMIALTKMKGEWKMKKLIAILVAMILMLPVVGMACEETAVLVARHETTNVYSDPSYWGMGAGGTT